MNRIVYAVVLLTVGAGLSFAGSASDEAFRKLDTNKDQSLSYE